ncbi:MAG: DNA recombination protein RmuC [Pseudomonadota bacterium]
MTFLQLAAENWPLLAAGALGLGVLVLFGRLTEARRRLAVQDAQLVAARALQGELEAARDEAKQLTGEKAGLEAQLREQAKAFDETRARLDGEFHALASKALEANHDAFLRRAKETFDKHQQAASNEAEARTQAFDALVKPISETLTRYEAGLKEMRETDAKREGEVRQSLIEVARANQAVRDETHKLVNALRAAPKTRGRWGEEALQNVIELAGMTPYCFKTQGSIDGEGGRLQPDVIVSLPGERKLAIDAKVSLNAYLSAVEALDEGTREALLAKHADEIWEHVKKLGSKEYSAALKSSLDFVVMFIPGENFFSAAVERRPELFQQAFDMRVLLATPTTLLAILKSVAYGWRQEKAADNAKHILELGKDLYASLQKMGGNFVRLGKSIDQTVGRFNDLAGNVEARVMPKARKFAELEVEGADRPVELAEPVETAVRVLRDDRDLLIEDQLAGESASSLSAEAAASGAGSARSEEDAA